MHRWLSGIAGLVGVVVFLLTIAYGPAGSPTPTALVGMSPAAAQTPTAAPGEPFYLKAIDHDKAKRGGTLRLAAHGPPSMFDIYASGTIANVGAQAPMYDLLVRMDPRDPKLPIIPSLATSWTISADGMTYTFQLRKGVKFHDGTDFTADDVKATFDRIVFAEGLPSESFAQVFVEALRAARTYVTRPGDLWVSAHPPFRILKFTAIQPHRW